MKNNKIPALTKLHPDFHIPGETKNVGAGLDGIEYAARLKEHQTDSVVVFAKCHYGYSYYPTKKGTVHPGLAKDLMHEVSIGAEKHGLECIAYYSVFLDTAAIKKNPQWRLQKTPQAEPRSDAKYEPVCVNSPYLEELMVPQINEVISSYKVSEMFFDTMSLFIPCYCPHCTGKFGADIPKPGDANWLGYVNWYHNCYKCFFARTAEAVHAINPAVTCTFNWGWSVLHPEEPVPHIKRLAGDLFPSGKVAGFYSRYWSGTGMPFDYMNGRFMHGLGDWVSNNDVTLQYTAAGSLASGGGIYLIDRQLPDGLLEERSYPTMQAVFGFVKERAAFITNTSPVKEVAVLATCGHIVGSDLHLFPDRDARHKRLEPLKAVHEILSQGGVHYTFLNEKNFYANKNQYALTIVPELCELDDMLVDSLAGYVQDGGNLLFIQTPDEHADPRILKIAGAEAAGQTAFDYIYVDKKQFVARGRHVQAKPAAGSRVKILAEYTDPLDCGSDAFGHGFAPPHKAKGNAAALLNKSGKGKIIYVSAPIISSHLFYYSPDNAEFILRMIRTLLPEPIVKIKTEALVELSVMRQDADLIVHMVNHSCPETLAGGWCPVVRYMPRVTDIVLEIKMPPGVKPEAEAFSSWIDAAEDNGRLVVSDITLDIMESVRVKNYF
ncbi:MAG: alpha-L-fucosidase [Defluviitaleaceae bacterium]|nr:alpha-L-fucosidase [Defluviitaleaceae bacterium]